MSRTASEMRRVEGIAELREALTQERLAGRRIGFVPTMGALHAGHVSLLRRCTQLCDCTALSIFVNPLQFGPNEDFARYPRDIERDAQLAADAGTALCFTPTVAGMYSGAADVSVVSSQLAARWEGAVRPGHFSGVLTVVAKLFNIVQPDIAVFGQKDYQQSAIIRAMVRDLDFPVQIVIEPTVRESDGLAMSSRNIYLSHAERVAAAAIPAALAELFVAWSLGEASASILTSAAHSRIIGSGASSIDYLAIVHPDTLEPVGIAEPGCVVLVAVRVGRTRLIDNVILRGQLPGELASALNVA